MDIFIAVLIGLCLVALVLGSRLPKRRPTAHRYSQSQPVEDGHVPDFGEDFTISLPHDFHPNGMYVSPSAYSEWYERIDALNMVPGSNAWEAYKEQKDIERERESLAIRYGDWR